MVIDFRKIAVKTEVEGGVRMVDVAKDLGNLIYRTTPDIGMFEFSREIYHKGEVDVSHDRMVEIIETVKVSEFTALVRTTLVDFLTQKLPEAKKLEKKETNEKDKG
nr:MAG TPA: hypothetical protein [Caudoviricetes sp.]